MKRKWIETGRDLLVILNNHLLLISIGITFMGVCKQEDHMMWLWSVLLVIPLFFYWARIKIRNFFLFYALHLVVPLGIIFLPISISPKFFAVFISIAYSIWSISIRIKERGCGEDVVAPYFMTGALAIMLLIETYHSQNGWEGIHVAVAIIYAAGYCLYLFISQYLRFLIVNESSAANIPEAEIFHNGFCQSCLYVAGVVTLLVLTVNVEWLSYIVSRIGNILLDFIRFLFSGVGRTEEAPTSMPVEQVTPEMGILTEAGEPALFWVILEKVAMIGVHLFIVGVVVFSIVKGFQYLWKGFYKTSEKEEKKIFGSIDVRESCTIEKTKKEGSNWFLFLNNGEKIRKIYRKQVLKHKTAIIGDLRTDDLEYMTAKECCDKFAAEHLKKMYEKARYSAEEITSDDVRAAKKDLFYRPEE